MPTIHPTIVQRLARVAAALALAAGAASGVAAQQPTTGTPRAQRDSARIADSTRAAARDTARRGATGRGARTRSAGGEVDRTTGVPGAGVRVTKEQGAAAPTTTPTPTPTTTTPTATPTNPTAPTSTTPPGMPSTSPTPTSPTTPDVAPTTPGQPATPGAPTAGLPPAGGELATSALVSSLVTEAHAVALLHEANLAEIEAGTRAQREARDSAVRAFATMMVTDHQALDQKAAALAQQAGVTAALPDSQLPRLQASDMAALPTAGAGAAFDSAYVAQQVAAHGRTLALVDAAIERAQNAELRTMLQTEVRPKVMAHLDAARQLQQRLGGR
jgi:putative membrane protein